MTTAKRKPSGGVSLGHKRAAGRTRPRPDADTLARERARLLQAAGAAAALFVRLDVEAIPRTAFPPVQALRAVLDALPERTLSEALEAFLDMGRTRGRAGMTS